MSLVLFLESHLHFNASHGLKQFICIHDKPERHSIMNGVSREIGLTTVKIEAYDVVLDDTEALVAHCQ